MARKKSDDLVEVVAMHCFIDPKTRRPVRTGDLYRTTQASAEELIALRQARALTPRELAGYNRRDMRAKD
jgi:hypothetical protein